MSATKLEFGVYEVLKTLTSGGFGDVHLCFDNVRKKTVAVKVLRTQWLERPALRDRFLEEAQNLRLLPVHRNIVRLLDFGETGDGFPYLVMEFLPGEDLRDEIQNNPMPVREAISICIQVAEALKIVSQRGIVHCDIKPENLKIEGGLVKVMDFGVARASDSIFRQNAGTPAYMAPELWQRKEPVPATDIYALGVVLYEMLTGRQPFVSQEEDDQKARQEIALLHQNDQPDWTPFRQTGFPPALLTLLQEMMEKRVDRRPSAEELIDRMEVLIHSIPEDLLLKYVEGIRQTIEETLVHTSPMDATFIHGVPVEGPAVSGESHRAGQAPSTPSPSTTVLDSTLLGSDTTVRVQLLLARVDLQSDVCRAALFQGNEIYAGAMNGKIHKIDTRSGARQQWDLPSSQKVVNFSWSMIKNENSLLLHTGGMEWCQVDTESGRLQRQGILPGKEMWLALYNQWVYMGDRSAIYRSGWRSMDQFDQFDPKARLNGPLLAWHGVLYASTNKGIRCLDTGSGQVRGVGPEQASASVTRMGNRRIAGVYITLANGVKSTTLRIFDVTTSDTTLLAETVIAGKEAAGPIQVAGNRVTMACRDGQLYAWNLKEENNGFNLDLAWERMVGAGLGIQNSASLATGILAVTPSKDNRGILVLLNAADGQILYEEPLDGDVNLSPLWFERKLCIILTKGIIQVYQVSISRKNEIPN